MSWKWACKRDTAEAYERHHLEYPQGQFASKAKNARIAKLARKKVPAFPVIALLSGIGALLGGIVYIPVVGGLVGLIAGFAWWVGLVEGEKSQIRKSLGPIYARPEDWDCYHNDSWDQEPPDPED